MVEEHPKFGSVGHMELHSSDPERTKAFYAKVFGWKFTDVPAMGYAMIEAPSPPNGGLRPTEKGEHPGIWSYIHVESVDKAIRSIEGAGGKILVPRQKIPNFGWFSVFEAPGGVVQAIWQAAPESQR